MNALDLQLSSGTLHALRSGVAGGQPVVCVAGLSANARSFDALAERLADARPWWSAWARTKRDVFALDLRGRGKSPATAPGSFGWRRHAQDVLEAAQRLGLPPIDLVGHSMGAFVSMQAAELAPERIRRLVLIDAAGAPEAGAIPPILASVQRLGLVYPSAEDYCEQIRRKGAAEPWELWEPHFRYELEPAAGGVRPATSRAAVMEDLLYGSQQDPSRLWPALRMPTLLVRAARPLGAGFVVGVKLRDAFVAAVPCAEVVEVDANHYGVMGHPESLRAIDAFLSRS